MKQSISCSVSAQGLPAFPELLRLARQGDPGAIDLIVSRYYPEVEKQVHERLSMDVRLGRPWLRARFSTGDVVHEVFGSILKDLSDFYGDTEAGFCGWLAMVVRNRIVDSIRHHEAGCRDGREMAPLPEGVDRKLEGSSTDPAAAAVRHEDFARLEAGMSSLTARQQYLIRGRIEGGLSFRELAEHTGFGSESTVRRAFLEAQSRLVIALSALRASKAKPR